MVLALGCLENAADRRRGLVKWVRPQKAMEFGNGEPLKVIAW